MKTNLKLRKEIFKIIENQIENNDPPETIKTFDKLKSQGYNDFEVKQLIGQCVAVEIYNVMKFRKPFDKERYIKNLNNLPKEPFE
jgi:hypothetical protein